MRKPGSTTIDVKGKAKPSADSRKPLSESAAVAAKRTAQIKEVTSEQK